MANEQPAPRGNPEEADCLFAPESTQENKVEILPPEEKPSADPQVPLRDYSANYRPLQPKPSAPEPPKPSTAAEHYRNTILISSAQKSAKQAANKNRILFAAALCLLCAVIGTISGTLSANIAIERNEASRSDSSAAISANSQTTEYRPAVIQTIAAETASDSTGSESDRVTTAADSIAGSEASAVASTNAAVAKTARDIYNESASSVVSVTAQIMLSNTLFGKSYIGQSTGSGFIVSADGYILTNYHVVEGGSDITVSFFDGSEKSATLVGFDKDNDIAVLKTEATRLNAVTLGDSDTLSVGDTVLIIGNPLGTLSYTLTSGVVSALNRELSDENSSINMFQTDAAVNSGNSGGPALNMDGEVIGIVTSKYADSTIEGLSFCIPINDVKGIIADIVEYGYARNKPLLSVSCQSLSASTAARYQLPQGAYIVALGAGGAADLAGLQTGDVITAIGDEAVTSVLELKNALKNYKSGSRITLTVFRDGNTFTAELVAQEAVPASPRTAYSNVYDL